MTVTNRLKQRLRDGPAQYGLFVAMVDPIAIEVTAGAGFDWLMIDMEHAPNDLRTVLAQLHATSASGVSIAVRPPSGDPVTLKRLLDIGVQTFVIPMVESAAQAADLVRAVRYPPRGIRGVGPSMARAAQWNRDSTYLATADDEICLVCQVESEAGVDAAGEIAGVDGVDAVFVGPSDLAASMGHLGNPGHSDVQAAVDRAIGATLDAGAIAGVFSADLAAARRFADRGVRLIAVGSDLSLFAAATTRLAADLRP
jgi:4-hydroxy-2-oxoheptanedioate aldolase